MVIDPLRSSAGLVVGAGWAETTLAPWSSRPAARSSAAHWSWLLRSGSSSSWPGSSSARPSSSWAGSATCCSGPRTPEPHMSLPPLAVTGSTGAVGGMVAGDLAARGVEQRLLVRSPARAPQHDRSAVVACSYGDRDASLAALDGVETLLMVSAAENAERLQEHRTFVDAAADAGVRHVVYTSFAGAAPDCTFTLGRDHWAT